MKQKGRTQRVAELIREEIAKLVSKGLKDPRIGFVSVMGVRMSADLRYANVYVSLFGSESERKSSLVALQNGAGWIRREVGKYLRMRYTPEIRFFADDSLEQVYHLEEVLEEIHREHRKQPMIALDLAGVIREFQAAGPILVTTHESPDGDAIGSGLGLVHLLRALGKDKVKFVLADPVPRLYQTLPGAKKIAAPGEKPPEYDLMVIIDVSSRDRIGRVKDWVGEDRRLLILDHHLESGPEGAMGFIDSSYGASGEIVADLYEAAGLPLSKEAAQCLYVAQITDTGCYRFSNATPRSHRIAARLLEAGIDGAALSAEIFDTMSLPKFELMRRVLDRIERREDGRLAWTYVHAGDLYELGAKREDIENLINYARNLEGVEVAVLFNAIDADTTKVSLRGKSGFNCAEFLSFYGGGGHAAAAGATVLQPYEDLRDEFLARIAQALNASDAVDAETTAMGAAE
jgi:phosphoesterase RecJ-like protein